MRGGFVPVIRSSSALEVLPVLTEGFSFCYLFSIVLLCERHSSPGLPYCET